MDRRVAITTAVAALCLGLMIMRVDAVCTAAQQALAQRLSPSSSNFCGWLNGTGSKQCRILNLTETGIASVPLTCGNSSATGTYNQVQPKTISTSGAPCPVPLVDLRPLPASVNASVVNSEGATYYWHYRVLRNLEQYTACSPVNGGASSFLVPTGWSLVRMINLPQSMARNSSNVTALPFAAVLRNKALQQLAIEIRGTLTAFEWDVDFTYQQIQTPRFPGVTHVGFTWAANQVLRQVSSIVTNHVKSGRIVSVFVAGHSLGSGVGTLVAYALQRSLNSKGYMNVTLSTVLFAPPNAGNATFVAAFNNLVNARRIAFVDDIVPQAPCPPTMVACANTLIPTNQPGNVTQWPYAQIGATVSISGINMTVQQTAWNKLTTVNLCDASSFLWASHVCSYLCYSSQFVNETINNCLLWETTNANILADNTYCTTYPTTPQYP